MTKLTAEAVEAVLLSALPETKDTQGECVEIQGVMGTFRLQKRSLQEQSLTIKELLAQLPNEFYADEGGGWSFLNMCTTANGSLWGQQRDVNNLIVLGLGLELVSFLMPRELWEALPGGMPYVQIVSKQELEAA